MQIVYPSGIEGTRAFLHKRFECGSCGRSLQYHECIGKRGCWVHTRMATLRCDGLFRHECCNKEAASAGCTSADHWHETPCHKLMLNRGVVTNAPALPARLSPEYQLITKRYRDEITERASPEPRYMSIPDDDHYSLNVLITLVDDKPDALYIYTGHTH